MEVLDLHQLGSVRHQGYAAPDGAWSVLRHPSAIDMALLTELFQRPISLETARRLLRASDSRNSDAGLWWPIRACRPACSPETRRTLAGDSP